MASKNDTEETPRKFYKLGPKSDLLWDPSQTIPENRKLLKGEVKELEVTPRVASAVRQEWIVAADAEDIAKAKAASEKAASDKKDVKKG